jgi:hypothetical protein
MGDDPTPRRSGSATCSGCGTPLAPGQRYCLVCGARGMALPAVIADWLERVRPKAQASPAKPKEPGNDPGAGPDRESEGGAPDYMPTPQAAAVAIMALLVFGVVIGSLTNQLAQSAGLTTVVLGRSAAAPDAPEVVAGQVEEEAPVSAQPPPPAAAPTAPERLEEPGEEAPAETAPPPKPPPELPPEPTLPPINHVFLIVLGEQGYEETFGAASQSTYFSQTLPAQGELLSNYYSVAPSGLSNGIALLSGQGPTKQTAADCPEYTEMAGTVGPMEQVEGEGCVYPPEAETLPGQLVGLKQTWKAYVEDVGSGGPGQPVSCRHPAPGAPDPDAAPSEGDGYLTWRNPFVYFHSLTDGAECAQRDVGLESLSADLANAKRTPSLSYIVPDACHDGSAQPCAPGQPAGLAGAEAFLQTVVPEIEKSPAYAAGGLIAITFAEAPQTGPTADHSSCCATPEYPNLKEPGAPPPELVTGPVKPSGGGGRVGMVLISPYVLPGSVNESGYYNHFSTLLSIEELFGLPALGYAAEPAITPFDETVYNNLES